LSGSTGTNTVRVIVNVRVCVGALFAIAQHNPTSTSVVATVAIASTVADDSSLAYEEFALTFFSTFEAL
tara:strand:- start:1390 stop:1596 length:207 start_codon:yes stop_codon:yes gene_type:complete